MARDHDMLAHVGGQAHLFRSLNQVIGQHPYSAARPRPEFSETLRQIVESFEVLHNDTLNTQIVSPHLFHDGRIVYALHPDPRRGRNFGLDILNTPGTGIGSLNCSFSHRPPQCYALALEQEASAQQLE
ncbi:hypothetical protein GCM10028828_11920 [Corynebacterium tapiri]